VTRFREATVLVPDVSRDGLRKVRVVVPDDLGWAVRARFVACLHVALTQEAEGDG
jgi:hypothetical protein